MSAGLVFVMLFLTILMSAGFSVLTWRRLNQRERRYQELLRSTHERYFVLGMRYLLRGDSALPALDREFAAGSDPKLRRAAEDGLDEARRCTSELRQAWGVDKEVS